MFLTDRASSLSSSPLQQLNLKKQRLIREGADIISLGVGEPAVSPPRPVKRAAVQAIENGHLGYVPAHGSLDIREKIAERHNVTEKEVAVSHGGKALLSAVLALTVDENSCLFIPAPYYPPFLQLGRYYGTEVVLMDTKRDGFVLTAEKLEEVMQEKPDKRKVLLINTPNNPTGVSYPPEEIAGIAEVCRRFSVAVISDECYSHFSPYNVSFRDYLAEAVVIDSFSKTYAMTGFRVGWAVCPSPIRDKLRLYLENHIGSLNAPAERAALEALEYPGIEDFSEQRKIVENWCSDMELTCVPGNGAFYSFPDVSGFSSGGSSVDLADKALSRGVAVVPGIAFGEAYDGHLRISYCLEKSLLEKGLDRLAEALKS